MQDMALVYTPSDGQWEWMYTDDPTVWKESQVDTPVRRRGSSHARDECPAIQAPADREQSPEKGSSHARDECPAIQAPPVGEQSPLSDASPVQEKLSVSQDLCVMQEPESPARRGDNTPLSEASSVREKSSFGQDLYVIQKPESHISGSGNTPLSEASRVQEQSSVSQDMRYFVNLNSPLGKAQI